jgi:outer membrane protein
MKSVFKICVLGILMFSAGFAKAQAPKFGHIDMQALYQVMPERAAGEKKMAAFQKELEDLLVSMQKDAQAKYAEYLTKRDSMSETIQKMKNEEINAMSERIQTFQQDAQQKIQDKQAETFKPMLDKADKAVKEVGAEKGLVYVFDMSTRVILYNSKESVDILPFVKTKLGIQ